MYSQDQTIWTVLVPMCVALVATMIAGAIHRKSPATSGVLVIVGLLAGVLICWTKQFYPLWPIPRDTTRVFPHVAILAGIVGVGLSVLRVKPGAASVVTGIASAAAVAFVTKNPALLALAFAAALLTRSCFAYKSDSTENSPTLFATLLLAGATVGTGLLIAMTGSLSISQRAIMIGCGLVGVVIASAVYRRGLLGAGGLCLAITTWMCALACAVAFSKTQLWQAVVLACVPALANAVNLPGLDKLKKWQSFVLVALFGTVITGAVVGLALMKMLRDFKADPYGY